MSEGLYKLPKGWRWVRLGEVCDYKSGVWAQPDPNGTPVLRSTDFLPDGSLSYETAIRLALTEKQIEKAMLQPGDILLERSGGGPNKPVGRVAYFQRHGTYCFGNFITRLRVSRADVESRFLFYWLYYFHVSGRTEPLQTQTTNIRNLRFNEYLTIPIPLPPLEEQRRIVALIEELMARVREAKRLREEAKQDTERLMQTILAEVFPRPGSNLPKGWRWVRLGEVCETKMGGTPKTTVPEYWDPGEIVWVTPEDMEKGVVNPISTSRRKISSLGLLRSSAKLFSSGTILLSTTATIGKVGIARVSLASNQQITGIQCYDDICPDFLAYFLLFIGEEGLRSLGGRATATHINQTKIRQMLIPLPPLEEQRRIVVYLEAVQERVKSLRVAQEATEAELQRLEQAILNKAFRGEL